MATTAAVFSTKCVATTLEKCLSLDDVPESSGAVFFAALLPLQLADEHYGVVGAKWRKVTCPESYSGSAGQNNNNDDDQKKEERKKKREERKKKREEEKKKKEEEAKKKGDNKDDSKSLFSDDSKDDKDMFEGDDFFKKEDNNNKQDETNKWRIRWPKWFDDL